MLTPENSWIRRPLQQHSNPVARLALRARNGSTINAILANAVDNSDDQLGRNPDQPRVDGARGHIDLDVLQVADVVARLKLHCRLFRLKLVMPFRLPVLCHALGMRFCALNHTLKVFVGTAAPVRGPDTALVESAHATLGEGGKLGS